MADSPAQHRNDVLPCRLWKACPDNEVSDISDICFSVGCEKSEHLRESNGHHQAEEIFIPPDMTDEEDERQCLIEERAGIMEFDGCLPRAEAERLAREWYAPVPF